MHQNILNLEFLNNILILLLKNANLLQKMLYYNHKEILIINFIFVTRIFNNLFRLHNYKLRMIGIVQLFVLLLIVVSFAMVVGVPVILATPGEWEKSQSIVWSGAGLWSALVILTGIFNTVPA